MGKQVMLKTNIFGGFNKKQVTDYILALQSEVSNTQAFEDIAKAQNDISDLTLLLSQTEKEADALRAEADELKEALESDSTSELEERLKADNYTDEQILAAKRTAKMFASGVEDNEDAITEMLDSLSLVTEKIAETQKNLSELYTKYERLSSAMNSDEQNDYSAPTTKKKEAKTRKPQPQPQPELESESESESEGLNIDEIAMLLEEIKPKSKSKSSKRS